MFDPSAYQRFTDELTAQARADERVIGLVALGSTASTDRGPDQWSDHDVRLVTQPGAAAEIRATTAWLPEPTEIVVSFAETEHGRTVIYRNGHVVEYAVFDDDELEIAGTNAYRVLYDACDIDARMAAMAAATAAATAARDRTGADRFGSFLSQVTIGVARCARGERLSANQMIRGRAASTLASLLASFVGDGPGRDVVDSLDPTRRFEQLLPGNAAEIDAALRSPLLEGARQLVDVAERELGGRLDAASPDAFRAVRMTLDRADRAGTMSS